MEGARNRSSQKEAPSGTIGTNGQFENPGILYVIHFAAIAQSSDTDPESYKNSKAQYNNQKIGNSEFLEISMTTLQIRGKGTITLPASLRKKYKLEEGEVLTVIDLGEGTILLKPMISQVNKLSRQIEKRLKEENISLDDLLEALEEERKTYYKKHYGKK